MELEKRQFTIGFWDKYNQHTTMSFEVEKQLTEGLVADVLKVIEKHDNKKSVVEIKPKKRKSA